MTLGRLVAFDVGAARIGVAISDPEGILATPVETLKRNGSEVRKAASLISSENAAGIIVGLPLLLDGSEGKSARLARRWAATMAKVCAPLPVYLVDERMSSVAAHAQLHEAGRSMREHKAVVDQVAASIILETVLEHWRTTGSLLGERVELSEGQPDAAPSVGGENE